MDVSLSCATSPVRFTPRRFLSGLSTEITLVLCPLLLLLLVLVSLLVLASRGDRLLSGLVSLEIGVLALAKRDDRLSSFGLPFTTPNKTVTYHIIVCVKH